MTDEAEQFIFADSISAAAEEPPRRRGIFRRRRRSKLPERPLTHCENCGAPLTGEFCAKCGQHAIDYRRSLFQVLIDAADSFFNWDTKFLKSIGLLLIRPWKLTNDFNAGRRARYVHPLRLYLLASIAFFLLARTINLESKGPIQLSTADRAELAASLGKLTGPDSVLSPEQREKVDAARAKLSQGEGALTEAERDEIKEAFGTFLKSSLRKGFKPEERAKLRSAIERIPEAPEPPSPPTPADQSTVPAVPDIPTATPKPKKKGGLHFKMDKEDGKTKKPFEAWLEGRIKEKVGEDGTKGGLFLDTLRSNIPAMMLCCIPLFAFVLKILYFTKKRFYVEHLVYALHIHTFLYVGVIVTALLTMAANRSLPGLSGLIIALFSCAIFVQIFLSIRRVYGQGWFFSAFKFLLGGIIYFVILIVGVAATAFVTLLLP
jgi:Protein of unknown function (DUF3667)